jgi:hypothetical protein
VTYADKNGSPILTKDIKPHSYPEIKKQLLVESAMTGSSIMVKTEILKEFGGYRDFFNGRGFEDYDLTSRIAEKYKTINLPEPLYGYRQHEESTSRKDLIKDPFKIHGHLLVRHFIQQRSVGQKDSLEQNDFQGIKNFMDACNGPYLNDPSLVHREVMWSYLHRKMIRRAFYHAITALRIRSFKLANWKALVLLVLISTGLRRF